MIHYDYDLDWKFVRYLAMCQNLVPLVNIKIAGKWMFIPVKMVLIGIDPYPFERVVSEALAEAGMGPKLLLQTASRINSRHILLLMLQK